MPVPAEPLFEPSRRPAAKPRQVAARALLLGGRLDTRSFEPEGAIATTPLTLRVEDGFALLFRYGVVVLVNVAGEAELKLLDTLRPRILDRFETVETEPATIAVQPDGEEQIEPSGAITL